MYYGDPTPGLPKFCPMSYTATHYRHNDDYCERICTGSECGWYDTQRSQCCLLTIAQSVQARRKEE